MCCGRPSSVATSLIVRNAPSALAEGSPTSAANDAVAQRLACAEGKHTARCDRHLYARFRITPDALRFVPQDEGAEARNLDVFALRQALAHMLDHLFDQAGALRARKADLAMENLGEVRPSQ